MAERDRSNGGAERLRQAARHKSERATRRADAAIRALVKRGERIDVAAVAAEAGVSRDFLYKHPDLRERILSLRDQGRDRPPVPEGERPSGKSRDVQIAVLTDEIKRLRAENIELRHRNEALYGRLLTGGGLQGSRN